MTGHLIAPASGTPGSYRAYRAGYRAARKGVPWENAHKRARRRIGLMGAYLAGYVAGRLDVVPLKW